MRCKSWAAECKRGCGATCFAEKLYRPSNGSEGEGFMDDFCNQCIHDNPDPESSNKCEILTATMCFYPSDKEYPMEWIKTADGPKCTKFVKWDWGNGDPDDPDNPNRPPDPPDPMQLHLFPLYHPELLQTPVLV
jgi:hypothetical protein